MVRGRQSQKRSLKKIIYIFTEGETEKNYFNMLNKKYRTSATVKVNISSGRKQGLALLNFALNKLQSLSESERKEIDKIYIVFDKDDISVDEMKTILKKIKSNSCEIEIGFSNSCFEVWLLYHFDKFVPIVKKDVFKKIEEKLRCTQYAKKHKNDAKLLSQLEDRIKIALENTQDFPIFSTANFETVPYTNLGMLVREIYDRDIY